MDVTYNTLLTKLKQCGVYCLPDDIMVIEKPYGSGKIWHRLHLTNGIHIDTAITDYDKFLNNFIKYKEYLRDSKLNQDKTN